MKNCTKSDWSQGFKLNTKLIVYGFLTLPRIWSLSGQRLNLKELSYGIAHYYKRGNKFKYCSSYRLYNDRFKGSKAI